MMRPLLPYVCVVALLVLGYHALASCGHVDEAVGGECVRDSACAQGEHCSAWGTCEPQPRDAGVDVTGDAAGHHHDGDLMMSWARYGTLGSRLESAEPVDDQHGYCGLGDVRTDDLGALYSTWYPEGFWGGLSVEPANGRCGDDMETLTWRLINCERMTQGLPPVDCDMRLVWISRQHASDMQLRGFFDHTNPDGNDPFRRLLSRGIDYTYAGENIARHRSVLSAHRAWMDSPTHRRNILTEQYSRAGVGIVRYGGQLYMTESFLRPPEERDAALELELR